MPAPVAVDAGQAPRPAAGTEEIRGRIVDLAGVPVMGVRVRAERDLSGANGASGSPPGGTSAGPVGGTSAGPAGGTSAGPASGGSAGPASGGGVAGPASAGVVAAESLSGPDGAFVLGGLLPGTYRLSVEGPGIVPGERRHVPAPGPDVELAVTRAVRVAGVVLDGALPASGATVEVSGSALPEPRQVTAGALGLFEVSGLPEGRYVVAARLGRKAAVLSEVVRAAGDRDELLRLELAPAGLVEGTVVDARTAAPLAGAVLILSPSEAEGMERRGASGPDGRFSFEGVIPGEFTLEARAPSYLPSEPLPVEVAAGAAVTLEIPLRAGAVLSGRVEDAAGRPVAGAVLEVVGEREGGRREVISAVTRARRVLGGQAGAIASGRLIPSGELGVMPGPIPYAPPPGAVTLRLLPEAAFGGAAAEGDASTFLSGPDGTFRLDAIPDGRFRVRARHPDFAPGESAPVRVAGGVATADRSTIVLTLLRGARVVGRVTSAHGAPIVGAEVAAHDGERTLAVAYADADGRYELPHLHGDLSLRVSAPGHRPVSRPLAVGPADEGRTIEVPLILDEASGRLEGRLDDAVRHPIAGAEILATGDRGDRAHARTDAFGRFVLTGLSSERYRLEARHPDFPPLFADARVGPAEVALVAPFGGGIAGELRDTHTRAPVPVFTLEAVGPGGAVRRIASRDGKFELSPLEAGTWRLTARARGYAPGSATVEVPAGRRPREVTVRGLVLELWRGGTIAGVVYDEHGAPAAGAIVEANGARVVSDARGRFRLEDVLPGEVPVRARHPTAGVGETRVPLRSGDEVLTIEVRLARQ